MKLVLPARSIQVSSPRNESASDQIENSEWGSSCSLSETRGLRHFSAGQEPGLPVAAFAYWLEFANFPPLPFYLTAPDHFSTPPY
jgi:hypothetical protein